MKKTAHFRRAVWPASAPAVLSDCIVSALRSVPTGGVARFTAHDIGAECLVARKAEVDGVYLHLVTYESGAPAAVVAAQARAAPTIDAEESKPPAGREFIRSQLYVYVQANSLTWASHNDALRERAIGGLLSDLVDQCSGTRQRSDFVLQPEMDREEFRRILDEGIEEIDLGLGAFKSELEYIANGGDIGSSSLFATLGMVFGRTPSAKDLAAAAKVRARLSLKPGRAWNAPDVMQMMSNLANGVLDDCEEFAIITKKKHRITQSKITIQKAIDVTGNRRLLSSSEVERNLREFYSELVEAGVIGG